MRGFVQDISGKPDDSRKQLFAAGAYREKPEVIVMKRILAVERKTSTRHQPHVSTKLG